MRIFFLLYYYYLYLYYYIIVSQGIWIQLVAQGHFSSANASQCRGFKSHRFVEGHSLLPLQLFSMPSVCAVKPERMKSFNQSEISL